MTTKLPVYWQHDVKCIINWFQLWSPEIPTLAGTAAQHETLLSDSSTNMHVAQYNSIMIFKPITLPRSHQPDFKSDSICTPRLWSNQI
mmetsp:Transcript_16138/g.54071  ORF Transcript_16138/g.54071 Transcript_16138/m.54071 type:complete len:88 (-) Transcript_16138:402-665(-)